MILRSKDGRNQSTETHVGHSEVINVLDNDNVTTSGNGTTSDEYLSQSKGKLSFF